MTTCKEGPIKLEDDRADNSRIHHDGTVDEHNHV